MMNANYQTAEDFNSPVDYMECIYGHRPGWICRGIKQQDAAERYSQYHYEYDDLIKQPFAGQYNVYLSPNIFCSPKRSKKTLKHLNALYVDLDTYKCGFTKEQVLYNLEKDIFDIVVPRPTFVLDSGRGLYCIWSIDEDRNALPRWKHVMNFLCDKLQEFGLDKVCKDETRILRVPYSINSKSDTPVKILNYYPYKYTLYEIIKEYCIKPIHTVNNTDKKHKVYPYGQATEKQRRYATALATKLSVALPNFNCFEDTAKFIKEHKDALPKRTDNIINLAAANTKPLLMGRARDIERLLLMRSGENCKREIGLFLYRYYIAEATGNYELALQATLELNNLLDCPFSAKYVETRTYSAEKRLKDGMRYLYTQSRLSEILDITPEEAAQLNYLSCGDSKAAERKRARNRRAYLLRLNAEGKVTKNITVKERRNKIIAMLKDGFDKNTICKKLNISGATYQRDKAAIITSGAINNALDTITAIVDKLPVTAIQPITEHVEQIEKNLISAAKKVKHYALSKIKPSIYKGSCIATSDSPHHGFSLFLPSNTKVSGNSS